VRRETPVPHAEEPSPATAAEGGARPWRELGERIARLREERGWKQKDLGRYLGTSQDVISHYECGDHAPKLAALLRLRQLFAVSLDYLVAGEAAGEIKDPRLKRLALAADALSYDNRTLVYVTAKMMVDRVRAGAERRAAGGQEEP
jgi:transcriptional regulator with XRE-family HTH domain